MTSTNALTKHCLKILSLSGFEVWRQNNNAVYDTKLKIFRSNSATKGISDIIGYQKKTGKFIAIEIKTGKDKLSIEQTNFLDNIKKNNGFATQIQNTEQLIDFLKTINNEKIN